MMVGLRVKRGLMRSEINLELRKKKGGTTMSTLLDMVTELTDSEETETTNPMRGLLRSPDVRRRYLLGGIATITLVGRNARYTYRITKKFFDGKPKPFFFVSVLVGSDNWTNYKYAGTLSETTLELRSSAKSKIADTAPSVAAFRWAMAHLDSDRFEFWHEGHCCRCGKKLTVPESIERGMGPDCATK
jgi:hypothetical protein